MDKSALTKVGIIHLMVDSLNLASVSVQRSLGLERALLGSISDAPILEFEASPHSKCCCENIPTI